LKAENSTSSPATAWRVATVLLIFALAWDALDPTLRPPHIFVLGSYFLLGFVCTAAFPRRAWIGILTAIVAAVGFELLQVTVPLRDVRGIELFAKWASAVSGVLLELGLVFLRQWRHRKKQ
jgi:VanZ family protein